MFYSFDYRGATIHTARDTRGNETVKYQLADYDVRHARSVHAAKCRITRAAGLMQDLFETEDADRCAEREQPAECGAAHAQLEAICRKVDQS